MRRLIIDKQPADRVGVYEHFWPETIRDYWLKEGYPNKDLPPGDHFGHDIEALWTFSGPGPFKGQEDTIEETDEWKISKNDFGGICKTWKNKSGTPEHCGFTIKNRADWDAAKGVLLELDTKRLLPETARQTLAKARQTERFSTFGGIFLFETMRAMIGDLEMLPALLLEPQWIHDICRVYTDFYKRHWAYLLDTVGRPDGVFIYEDLGFTNGLFCSPKLLREIILPYYKELFGMFKQDYGLPVILHSCGDIRRAVPLIIEAGVDCLQPMEAKAGVNVLELADTYGNKLAYMGNIDVTVLNQNDKKKVRAEVERKMGGMIQRRMPYILHSDHSIPPDVRLATYQFMLELHREQGNY
jgi:uroporphyrinogen decarboxylase